MNTLEEFWPKESTDVHAVIMMDILLEHKISILYEFQTFSIVLSVHFSAKK